MASTKDYCDFVLGQLSALENITYRKMMGEYLLYYNGTLFGGIYDDRLLVKKTDTNHKYQMEENIPYIYPCAFTKYNIKIVNNIGPMKSKIYSNK